MPIYSTQKKAFSPPADAVNPTEAWPSLENLSVEELEALAATLATVEALCAEAIKKLDAASARAAARRLS